MHWKEDEVRQLAGREKETGREIDAWAVIRAIEANAEHLSSDLTLIAKRTRSGSCNVFQACTEVRAYFNS